MKSLLRLRAALFFLLVIILLGTLGYMLIGDLSFVDAVYMTVITISTVGFKEVAPLHEAGKVFTIVLIISGISCATYTASSFFQFMIEGHLMGLMKRRKMERIIEALKKHYIICGFGRVGAKIARDFEASGKTFVVVDNNPETIARLKDKAYLFVEGNASEDEVLKRARIEHAAGLVAASDSDPDNVLITLSARMLNPELFIVSRASTDSVLEKLYKAGANRVVSPYKSAAQKMTTMLLRPLVHDYLDMMAKGKDLEIGLEEIELTGEAGIIGKSIGEAAIRKRTGTTILAIKNRNGEVLTNPAVSTVLEEGDRLIVVGTPEQLASVYAKLTSSEQ